MVSVRMVEWAEEYPFITIARLEDRSIWALSLTWNLSNELPESPILRSSFPESCMQALASLVVILSSNVIVPSPPATCCGSHKDLDPRWMRPRKVVEPRLTHPIWR